MSKRNLKKNNVLERDMTLDNKKYHYIKFILVILYRIRYNINARKIAKEIYL